MLLSAACAWQSLIFGEQAAVLVVVLISEVPRSCRLGASFRREHAGRIAVRGLDLAMQSRGLALTIVSIRLGHRRRVTGWRFAFSRSR